jgi:hypothetical protein
MNRTLLTRTIAAAAVAAAATLSAPAPLAAQIDTVVVTPTNPKADRMVETAQRMVERARWQAAAEMYLRAARTRTADDARASGNYAAAANLFFAARDLDASINAMIESGDHALGRGDVVTAAHAYLNAGWVAGQKRDARTMMELTNRARLLASSPQLTVAQRDEILRRAGDPNTLAVTAIQ